MSASTETAADLIIPVHNQYSYTRNLIEGIYRYSDAPFHIYIIDNASTDETTDLHKIYTHNITIVRNRENRGWCGGINQGISLGQNPYVVFMNNDIEVSQGWLGSLTSFLDTHPRIGAVGPLDSSPNDWQCVDRVRDAIVPQIPNFLTEDLHERNRILKYPFQQSRNPCRRHALHFSASLLRDAPSVPSDSWMRALLEAGMMMITAGVFANRVIVLGLSLDTYVIHHSKLNC